MHREETAMWTMLSPLRLALVFLVLLSGQTALTGSEARFPLRIATDGNHLEDAAGKPFLITGDSAWSLIADLSPSEADIYIADRKARGFNTILVSLIEHEFARNAPKNAAGIAPFLAPGDFSRPDERYFAAAEHVLDAALNAGMLVLLAPAYIGANGGSQGWYAEMAAAGPDALRDYGRYVGKRYARYPNIVWVQGGDYDPPDRKLVEALAEGVAEGAPGAMQTVHGNRDTATNAYWSDAGWLALDTVYTYEDTAAAVLARYRSGPRRPFLLIESRYENEHGVNASEVRKIAYGALLSGASGQVFGNNPVWHFGGPALYEAPVGWRGALGSEGAQSITHLAALFDGLDWWTLKPDEQQRVRIAEGSPSAGVVSAFTGDGRTAVAYLHDATSIDLDLSTLADPIGDIEWYDPSTGKMAMSTAYAEDATSRRLEVPAATNAGGATDWVLIVRGGAARDRAASRTTGEPG
jgi:hypothetical protein